ncbi:hypothetical protein [Methyloprofundus sp.]|uniref:hypothetical protein n=1 Tax=Methyloprofundus sp. TaxID=2020875 RepID=UPI003D10DEA8
MQRPMLQEKNMPIANQIADVIIQVAKKENTILSTLANEGIFHMPELAFAYECGKAIMQESSSIFKNVSFPRSSWECSG